MTIAKRKLPKRKPKIKPKPKSKHVKYCETLYNRLHKDAHSVFQDLAHLYGFTYNDPRQMDTVALGIASRCSMEIKTFQANWPDHLSYQVHLSYEDRDAKPLHGYLYPKKYVVKSSPSLALCLMLCFIELCKNHGRWI